MAKQHYTRVDSDGKVEHQVFNGHPGRTQPQWKLDDVQPKPKPTPKKKAKK